MNENLILQQSIHKLFDKGSLVLFRWKNDAQWSIEYVSQNVGTLLGYSQEEFLEEKISYAQTIHPQFLKDVEMEVNAASSSGEEFFEHKPYKIITKDGSEKWILDQTLIERDEHGEILSYVGYISDITKTVELKEQNELLAQRVALAVESTHDGIWDWDFVSNEVFFSHHWKAMLGYGEDEINATPEAFYSLIHPHDRERANNALQKHLSDPAFAYAIEIRLLCKDGSYKWILSRGKAIFDSEMKPLRMLGSHIDIDQQKKIFNQLQEAQKIAKIGIWELYHLSGKLVWSDVVFDIFEIDKEKFAPSYEMFLDLVHAEDREEMHTTYLNSLKTKKPYELTHRLQMSDGRIKYMLEQCSTDFDTDGSPILSRGTVQDITEFTMLDAAMRSERRRFKAFMDNSSDGIMILNKNLRVVDYSRVAKDMLGYSDIEMLQLHVHDWDIHFDATQIAEIAKSISKTPSTFETIHKRKDNTTYHASITSVLIEIDKEEYLYSSVRDISERKALQERVLYEKNFIETIIESSNAIIAVINSEGKMIKFNKYAQDFSGYSLEEISKEPYFWRVLLPESVRDRVSAIVERAKNGEIIKSHQNRWISKTGEERLFEWSNTLVKKADGAFDYIATIGIDITQQEEQKAFLELLINSQSHMVLLADGSELKYANRAVLDFFAINSLEEMQLRFHCISDAFIRTDFSYAPKKGTKGLSWIDEIQSLEPTQQIVTMYSAKELKDQTFKLTIEHHQSSKNYLFTFTDISATMSKQLELEYKSHHDTLTKALNRGYFEEHIDALLHMHQQTKRQSAIAMIDIDHFKNINDTHGHDVGDTVLRTLVLTIKSSLRESDLLVRWGGEEFLLLLPVKNIQNLQTILQNLQAKINITAFEHVGVVHVSIGATIFQEGEDIQESIKRADLNLYESKNSGRNRVTVL